MVAGRLGARVAPSLEAALEGNDLALIATPPASHAELVQRAGEAGLDVFCEKPFVRTVADARALIQAARAAGRLIYVGHFRRTFPALQQARRLVMSGVLGTVTALDVREGGRFTWAAATDYFLTDPAGGVLLDTGSHAVDMALYAAGLDEVELAAKVRSVAGDRTAPEHEFSGSAVLQADGKAVALGVGLSRRVALANRVRVVCEHGSVDVPVGLLGRLRVNGPGRSDVLATPGFRDYGEAFALQWQWLLAPEGAGELRAERFVGLTAILETFGAAARAEAA